MPRDAAGSNGYHSGMATASDIPSLDGLLDSILDRLSRDAVSSLAAMRPKGARKQETFADQVVRMVQAKAKARVDGGAAEPLPDVPRFNELTRRTLADVDAGRKLAGFASMDDLFADLDD